LLLNYPGIAATPCELCSKQLIDHETGLAVTEKRGDKEFPILRDKPPCKGPTYKCPKESPEREHLHTLSPENLQCWNFYRRQKAGGFPMELDDLALENFAIIAEIEQAAERHNLAKLLYPKIRENADGP
jgi:hypothetical protein